MESLEVGCEPGWSWENLKSLFLVKTRKYSNIIYSSIICGLTKVNIGLFQSMRDMALWYWSSSIRCLVSGIHLQFQISKPLMNIVLSTLNMFMCIQKLPYWEKLARNPSPCGEIISAKSSNKVQVPRGTGPMSGWSYNLRTATKSLRLFIPVLIPSFYLIITVGMI